MQVWCFKTLTNQLVATIVEEDVALDQKFRSTTRGNKKRVDEALEKVGMSEYKRHAPHLLSGDKNKELLLQEY